MSGEADSVSGRCRLFLSYARADRTRAALLAHALEAIGFDVWWDDRLQGGEAFAGAIEQALERADAILVAWSAASVQSDWVRDEAARGRDRKCLIALSLDGAHPPLGFGQYHSIDFSGWRGRPDAPEIGRLVEAIGACAATAPAPPPTRRTFARPLPPSGDRRRGRRGDGGGVGWRLAAPRASGTRRRRRA